MDERLKDSPAYREIYEKTEGFTKPFPVPPYPTIECPKHGEVFVHKKGDIICPLCWKEHHSGK